jgi:hypothetical protein
MSSDKDGRFVLFNHNEDPQTILDTITAQQATLMVCCIQNIPGILDHVRTLEGWGIFYDAADCESLGTFCIMWNKAHLYIDPKNEEKTMIMDNPPKNTFYSISVFLHAHANPKHKYVITLLHSTEGCLSEGMLFDFLSNAEGLRYQHDVMASHYIFNNLKKDYNTLSYFEVESYYPIGLFPHDHNILSDSL